MFSTINLTSISSSERIAIADELKKSLLSVNERDFIVVVTALKCVSKEDLEKAWTIVRSLENIVESNKAEILQDARNAHWLHKKGY